MRRAQARVRSERLLADARAPNDLDMLAHRQPALHCDAPQPKFRPTINPVIPDFKEQHAAMETRLTRSAKRPATQPEPFFLRTSLIPSRKDRVVQVNIIKRKGWKEERRKEEEEEKNDS